VAFVTGYLGDGKLDTNISVHPAGYDSYFITSDETLAKKVAAAAYIPIMVDCPVGPGAMQSYLSSSAASKTLKVFPQLHLPIAYDFVVWFDNKFSVNLKGVERAVGT
jgi:hypothetical protein